MFSLTWNRLASGSKSLAISGSSALGLQVLASACMANICPADGDIFQSSVHEFPKGIQASVPERVRGIRLPMLCRCSAAAGPTPTPTPGHTPAFCFSLSSVELLRLLTELCSMQETQATQSVSFPGWIPKLPVKSEGEREGVCGIPLDHSVNLTFSQREKDGREEAAKYLCESRRESLELEGIQVGEEERKASCLYPT